MIQKRFFTWRAERRALLKTVRRTVFKARVPSKKTSLKAKFDWLPNNQIKKIGSRN